MASIVIGVKTFPQEDGVFVQILHHKDHWIVVRGLDNGRVDAFDSSSSRVLSPGFVSQIKGLREKGDTLINMRLCQQQ